MANLEKIDKFDIREASTVNIPNLQAYFANIFSAEDLRKITLYDLAVAFGDVLLLKSDINKYLDDERVNVSNYAALPTIGDVRKRYITQNSITIGGTVYPASHSYVWNGVDYADITAGDLILGEISTTAYRGDRGKVAYDFVNGVNFSSLSSLDNITSNVNLYPTASIEINGHVIMFGRSCANIAGSVFTASQIVYCVGGYAYIRMYNSGWYSWMPIDKSSNITATSLGLAPFVNLTPATLPVSTAQSVINTSLSTSLGSKLEIVPLQYLAQLSALANYRLVMASTSVLLLPGTTDGIISVDCFWGQLTGLGEQLGYQVAYTTGGIYYRFTTIGSYSGTSFTKIGASVSLSIKTMTITKDEQNPDTYIYTYTITSSDSIYGATVLRSSWIDGSGMQKSTDSVIKYIFTSGIITGITFDIGYELTGNNIFTFEKI